MSYIILAAIVTGLAFIGLGALLFAQPVPQPPHYD